MEERSTKTTWFIVTRHGVQLLFHYLLVDLGELSNFSELQCNFLYNEESIIELSTLYSCYEDQIRCENLLKV